MSTYFKFRILVKDFNESKLDAIGEAAKAHWDFEGMSSGKQFELDGEGSCSADPEPLLAEIVQDIWKANGAYCPVDVQWLHLENLPWEYGAYDETDYKRYAEEP